MSSKLQQQGNTGKAARGLTPDLNLKPLKNVKSETESPQGVDRQPVAEVHWVERTELFSNSYNPNHVPPPELKLLKLSILEDGWTQPIVARASGEIVDGFHRWSVSGDADVSAMTKGLVPVVYLRADVSEEHQVMSTVRHNRARGSHYVVAMAEIVEKLAADGVTEDEMVKRLGMHREEVQRLLDRGMMNKRHAGADFSQGFTFVGSDRPPDLAQAQMDEKAALSDDGHGDA